MGSSYAEENQLHLRDFGIYEERKDARFNQQDGFGHS